MQGLEKEVAVNYGLEIKNLVAYKDGYLMNTSRGRKFLKKSTFSPERILFIHSVKEYLYANHFINLDRFLCTTAGKPYITIENVNYTVADAIEGRECNFESREDVIEASNLLARLHKSSRGYKLPDNILSQDDLGKLPQYFNKRLEDIKRLKKIARKGKTKFDYAYLEYVDYFYNLGKSAYDMIYTVNYDGLVDTARKEGILCHHDFTHHNIIFTENDAYIVNFDFCCFELKVYDLANLLRRKMRKCNWDIGEAKVILDEYSSIEPLSDSEFFIMKLMLQFPQKFWRVANKYYNTKRSWSEKIFLQKLQEVIDEIEFHKQFMGKIDQIRS